MAYFNILMIFALICLYIGLGEASGIFMIPSKPKIHLLKGAPLKIDCVFESSEVNVSGPNFSYSNSLSDATNESITNTNARGILIGTMVEQLKDGISRRVTTLTKNETVFADTGSYKCNVDTFSSSKDAFSSIKDTASKDVYIFAVDGEGADLPSGSSNNITLNCKLNPMIPMIGENNYQVHWKFLGVRKNDQTKDLFTGEKYNINKGSLMIHNPSRSDIGEYVCIYVFLYDTGSENDTVTPKAVQLRASPMVDHLDNNKNMVQGEEVDIKCEVSGFPLPDVVWRKNGFRLNSSQRIHFLQNGKNQVKIYSLDFSDEGDYACYAENLVAPFNDSKIMKLRVKDKLAALWPFLGIVAEVIILCAIILIYEKRRSKKLADDDDAPDSNPDNTVDHKDKDKDVRHRKS